MNARKQPETNEVIDLTEARHRNTGANETASSGLHRETIGHTPPWRPERTSTIVDRPEVSHELATEPSQLRQSLFTSEERVLSSKDVEFKPALTDRSLGKPNGSRWQRLKKRK